MADQRLELLRSAADEIEPGPHALPLAALELWVGARTDPELRAALMPPERRLGRALRDIFEKASAEADPEQSRLAFDSLLIFLRGLAITSILREDDRSRDDVMGYWLDHMALAS